MTPESKPKTIPQLLRNVTAHIHDEHHTFMLEKVEGQWHEISYKTTLEIADSLSAFFLKNGIQKGDRLALLIENSPEYVYFDQALQQIGAINVSVYPTLAEHEIEYILNDSGAKAILVGNPFLFRKILKISNNCTELQLIIPAFKDFSKYVTADINSKIEGFEDALKEGRSKAETWAEKISEIRHSILPSDISSLIYTSGTTGTPKGVMLTHSNFIENVEASLQQITAVDKTELFLSFLPLSHVFERTATYYICSAKGCKIAFAESLELLARNMLEIKPTVMIAVPRLLERIHDKAIKNGTSAAGTKAKIFLWALAVGKQHRETLEAGKSPGIFLSLKHAVANKLVFSKIKEKTGSRLKFMVSGGGALPKNVGEFFGNIGIKILEGFGLTETSPVVAVTEFQRQVYGTVGRIIPGVEVSIQDIETKEMIIVQNHDSFNPNLVSHEGEILVRGHCVMKGYWKKPLETSQVIDEQGWFHTGDVGRFYKGYLQITDRIKNMLVNAYGKNIYPTPVENIYLKSPKIEQIFLIGDRREYITAIVIPSKEALQESFGVKENFFQNPDVFIEDKEIINWISQDIKRLSNELAKFERIKNFKVKRNPFTIEAGEITPTLKAKRKVIEAKYANEINQLYAQSTDE